MKKILGSIGLAVVSISLFAHGSMEVPISRTYQCYKEGPESPKSAACKAAVQVGGTQPLYNWHEVNQAAANDRHRELIADGQLCAGGRDFFKGFNLARTDWTTTVVHPDSNGRFQFVYVATAPHKTKYFKFYVTKDGYDFNTPLKWSDLETSPFCTITSVTLANGRYQMDCPLPANRTGKRIFYVIWQREDSPEAFYSCSDVFIDSTAQAPTWFELQNFYGSGDIAANTKITLRVFKHEVEVESTSITVTESNRTAEQWPLALGAAVNNRSSLVRIGQLDPQSGQVVLAANQANKIYLSDSDTSSYHVLVDFAEPSGNSDLIYPDGISTYKAGTIVLGRLDRKYYQCKPWPYSGWCSQAPAYYEPGVGLAWREAWILLG
ncbi:TPA: lytic polysaccharide monooxygenase [Legionella pneumophila]|uniref:Chitin-binding protein n=1 Tax=Legionella pneumophila subsp. pneumophila TaxID=91891 RepID=A0A3A6VNN3_LEGPN|nr:lytic polysaccharide monooxygenase [Legionella pneumophila]ERH44036.1 Chitin-binding protein CbpD [Legionella pneumophila str. Leg01/53]ERH44611.1 Chitin-binding protein CbpD [Legionella pneumophila str. Leg01/11]ERI48205.1 Chitin-binding protein CbpD [Legionella pneumophila str. Leg01/20]AGH55120.1 secreted cellulose-binding protein [Legionella pneumophila subsp. pneumophila LPE509]ANN94414.1 chitin-binding protein [Legionella pneumophila]